MGPALMGDYVTVGYHVLMTEVGCRVTDDRYVVLCYVKRSEVDDGCTHVYTNVKRSEVY